MIEINISTNMLKSINIRLMMSSKRYNYKTLRNVDYDDYIHEHSETCPFCKANIQYRIPTLDYDSNKRYNACLLCNTLLNLQKSNSANIILCYSKLTQRDIIKKTIKKYYELCRMPIPNEVDPKVKYIQYLPYAFVRAYESMSDEQKTLFRRFKFFFTDKINMGYMGFPTEIKIRADKYRSTYPEKFYEQLFKIPIYKMSHLKRNLITQIIDENNKSMDKIDVLDRLTEMKKMNEELRKRIEIHS